MTQLSRMRIQQVSHVASAGTHSAASSTAAVDRAQPDAHACECKRRT
jgi:hypothetical protein